jgi:hypothetical protein
MLWMVVSGVREQPFAAYVGIGTLALGFALWRILR